MSEKRLRIVILGLSLSSSWGNGHATTYRALVKALARRGHDVLFLERDRPWYASNRDLADPGYCRLAYYTELGDLERYRADVTAADAVVVGSYVPDGIEVGEWVLSSTPRLKVFYDIDTPVTVTALRRAECTYLAVAQVPRYDLYLSFTGGPILEELRERFGAAAARVLHCSVDAGLFRPARVQRRWDLGYLGTYSPDRQQTLEKLLVEPARRLPRLRFVVAGAQFPASLRWPANVERIEHVSPAELPRFYSRLRWALNVTRADMREAGFSPSVRLFEAAACGVPIVSDAWRGLETLFRPGIEIVTCEGHGDVEKVLGFAQTRRDAIAEAARAAVLRAHTAGHRARQLEGYLTEAMAARGQEPRKATFVVPGSREFASEPATSGDAS